MLLSHESARLGPAPFRFAPRGAWFEGGSEDDGSQAYDPYGNADAGGGGSYTDYGSAPTPVDTSGGGDTSGAGSMWGGDSSTGGNTGSGTGGWFNTNTYDYSQPADFSVGGNTPYGNWSGYDAASQQYQQYMNTPFNGGAGNLTPAQMDAQYQQQQDLYLNPGPRQGYYNPDTGIARGQGGSAFGPSNPYETTNFDRLQALYTEPGPRQGYYNPTTGITRDQAGGGYQGSGAPTPMGMGGGTGPTAFDDRSMSPAAVDTARAAAGPVPMVGTAGMPTTPPPSGTYYFPAPGGGYMAVTAPSFAVAQDQARAKGWQPSFATYGLNTGDGAYGTPYAGQGQPAGAAPVPTSGAASPAPSLASYLPGNLPNTPTTNQTYNSAMLPAAGAQTNDTGVPTSQNGQSLFDQDPQTQQMFQQQWGDQAASEWARENDASLSASLPQGAQLPADVLTNRTDQTGAPGQRPDVNTGTGQGQPPNMAGAPTPAAPGTVPPAQGGAHQVVTPDGKVLNLSDEGYAAYNRSLEAANTAANAERTYKQGQDTLANQRADKALDIQKIRDAGQAAYQNALAASRSQEVANQAAYQAAQVELEKQRVEMQNQGNMQTAAYQQAGLAQQARTEANKVNQQREATDLQRRLLPSTRLARRGTTVQIT